MERQEEKWTALRTAQFWKYELGFLKRSDLPDFAEPEGANATERLKHRWAKLCNRDAGGNPQSYKAYTLTPHQTARVEFMLCGLEDMTDVAFKLLEEVEQLKQELAEGPQATVDHLIAYLDPDPGTRKR